MSKKSKSLPNPTGVVGPIVRLLEKQGASGRMNYQIFEDFCALAEASLEALPAHFKSSVQEHRLAEDTPETQALFEKLRGIYPKDFYWQNFQEAFGLLLHSTENVQDVIGDVYMQFSNPSGHNGQYFTPWNVAECMAEMTIMDGPQMVQDHMKQALDRATKELDPAMIIFLESAVLVGMVVPDEQKLDYYFDRIWPIVAPYYEPVSVMDPAVGSGVMLLAASKQFPGWMNALGLVQYYGNDISHICVSMARINCMLYGLNGYAIKFFLDLSPEELAALPEAHQEIYTAAQEAYQNNDTEELQALEVQLRNVTQPALFDVAATLRELTPEKTNGKVKARKNGAKPAEQATLFQSFEPEVSHE